MHGSRARALLAGSLLSVAFTASAGVTPESLRELSSSLRGPVEAKVKEFLTKGAAEGLKAEAESS